MPEEIIKQGQEEDEIVDGMSLSQVQEVGNRIISNYNRSVSFTNQSSIVTVPVEDESTGPGGLSLGWKIGFGVGVPVLIVAVAVIIFLMKRR